MLAGTVLRTKVLTDTCGKRHDISIIQVSRTPANRTALIQGQRDWLDQAQRQPPEVRYRGTFAADTAAIAAGEIRNPDPNIYIVAAQDETGKLRGLSLFRLRPDTGSWYLGLHTVQPADQLGATTGACVLRGVGSEMLGADMALMTSRVCSRTELEPLDDRAEAFWRARGFVPAGDGLALSCPGMQGLAAAYAHSPTDDQDMLVMSVAWLGRVSLVRYRRSIAQEAV